MNLNGSGSTKRVNLLLTRPEFSFSNANGAFEAHPAKRRPHSPWSIEIAGLLVVAHEGDAAVALFAIWQRE